MQVIAYLRTLIKNWDGFWFAPRSLKAISLFRLIFCSALFIEYSWRAVDMKILFFNDGLMPSALASEFMSSFYRPLFYWFPTTDEAVVWVHVIFLFSLFILAIGIVGRKIMWLAWALHLSLIQRNYTIIYGADIVASFWLFYLSFIESHRYYSLWSWWKRRKSEKSHNQIYLSDSLSSVGIRLIQIQLCIIYAYTGWEKLKGSEWWEGTAIWHVLGSEFLASFDLSFISHFPLLVVGGSWLTLVFEIYFCVMVWNKKMRSVWLFIGLLLHLGIALMMNLYFFGIVMVSAYLSFFNDWPQWLRQREFHRRPHS